MKIGVLGLQGAFIEHIHMLGRLGVETVDVRLPEELDDLRAEYPCLERASHMSPVHWSAVRLDGSAPARILTAWIRQSYNLVVAGLPKKIRTNYPTL